VDLRVNTLKADRDRVMKALARFSPLPTPYSPAGIRLPAPDGPGRQPNVEVEAGHGKGWYEVQDEGSQLAALMAGAAPRGQVLDICAGAGGKTLALAALMENRGQVYAFDSDKGRLAPIFDRLKRAGARNVQVLSPEPQALDDLAGRMDRVLVDAPSTGTGVWRRRPDATSRVTPEALARRTAEQDAALARAAPCVKPGGVLVYATCSLLPPENGERVEAFLAGHPEFQPIPAAELWEAALPGVEGPAGAIGPASILLTPISSGVPSPRR
jgi:16S rRNA (cytosine967-C5)-methyltransferase